MNQPIDPPHEPADEPALDPARETAVRRLLAEAGGPEPMPAHVADRLDATLAGLAAEQATPSAPPTAPGPTPGRADSVVIGLDAAARKRRVRARWVLGAAAAVIIGGVAAGVVNDRDSASDSITAADEMAGPHPTRQSADDAAGEAAQPPAEEGDDAPTLSSATPSQLPVLPRLVVTDAPLRTVRSATLREDLVALQHVVLPDPDGADYSGESLHAPADFVCDLTGFGPGHLVGVEYDGRPAVVAFRAPVGETQGAEVLSCGTGDPLRSTTLTATY